MKHNTTTSAPRPANHPPLAHDDQGNAQPVPEGTASWLLKRETGGRPRPIKGADRQPLRFALDTTRDDLEEMLGVGTFRVYAITEVGETIDYVTTIAIGQADDKHGDEGGDGDDDGDPWPVPRSARAANSNAGTLRHALYTIASLAKANADALVKVAEAQADFVKGLATAKALPRNAPYTPPPPASPPPVADDDHDDEESDEESDEEAYETEEEQPVWLQLVQAVAPAVNNFSEIVKLRNSPPAPAPPPPPAAPRNARPAASARGTILVAEVMAQLDPDDRRWLLRELRLPRGLALVEELLGTDGIDDALDVVRTCAREHREKRATRRPPADDGTASPSATPSPAPSASGARDFMGHVMAVAAHLSAAEQAVVMSLVPRFASERGEELKTKLLQMTPVDAAAWIRDNLDALRAEVAS